MLVERRFRYMGPRKLHLGEDAPGPSGVTTRSRTLECRVAKGSKPVKEKQKCDLSPLQVQHSKRVTRSRLGSNRDVRALLVEVGSERIRSDESTGNEDAGCATLRCVNDGSRIGLEIDLHDDVICSTSQTPVVSPRPVEARRTPNFSLIREYVGHPSISDFETFVTELGSLVSVAQRLNIPQLGSGRFCGDILQRQLMLVSEMDPSQILPRWESIEGVEIIKCCSDIEHFLTKGHLVDQASFDRERDDTCGACGTSSPDREESQRSRKGRVPLNLWVGSNIGSGLIIPDSGVDKFVFPEPVERSERVRRLRDFREAFASNVLLEDRQPIDDFFARTAGREEANAFVEKYNFDIMNDKPLVGGKYEWEMITDGARGVVDHPGTNSQVDNDMDGHDSL